MIMQLDESRLLTCSLVVAAGWLYPGCTELLGHVIFNIMQCCSHAVYVGCFSLLVLITTCFCG